MTSATLLAIVAHPDDEGSCGGSLARYAAAGARVYVACATRGDGPDAQIKNAAATRETLGQVRSGELACACQTLGAQPPLFLGFADGFVDHVPPAEGAQRVAGLIRALRPQVVITHDPAGGYGHPDHIALCHLVTAGFDLAGQPAAAVPGVPHAPARLYYFAIPRSFKDVVPALRDRRADIRGGVLGFVGVPDEDITTEVDIQPWLQAKQAALSCHRSQFEFDPETGEPKSFATSVPPEQRLQWFGRERFVRARPAGPAPAPDGRETDLLAGLG